jgi:hypothetical protein
LQVGVTELENSPLYGYETWSLALRKEDCGCREQSAEENIRAQNNEEIAGWKKRHNQEINDLHSSSIIMVIK